MNRCDTLRDNLKAYLDGELPVTERLALRLHLSRCPACRKEAELMEHISNELHEGDAGILEAGLRNRLLGNLPDNLAEPAPDLPKNRRIVTPKKAFLSAAIVTVGWFIIYPVFGVSRERTRQTSTGANKSIAMKQDYDTKAEDKSSTPSASENPAEDAVASGTVPAIAAPRAAMKTKLNGMMSRQVHKTASLTLEVDKAETKSETVEQAVRALGGYVAQNQLNTNGDGTKTAALTVKVPVAQFEAFLAQVSKLGDVKAKSLTGEDVTEANSNQQQSVRVLNDEIREQEAHIRSARRVTSEDREALRELRTQQAQEAAQLEIMQKLAALSDVTIELREKAKEIKAEGGFLNDIKTTAHDAGATFAQAARLPVVLLIWAIAYLPLWIALLVAYRVVARLWLKAAS